MEINGSLHVGYVSSNRDEAYITIEIRDEDSGVRFVKTKLTLEEFTKLTMGHRDIDAAVTVSGLDRIGKVMEIGKMSFKMPNNVPYTDIDRVACELAVKNCLDGWEPDLYFGSQDSFRVVTNEDGEREEYAYTIVRRWVEKTIDK